jgi:predicted DsbA family dithiol-disulfide isomerase
LNANAPSLSLLAHPSSTPASRVNANYDQAVKQGAQATPSFIIVSSDGTTKKISGAQPYSVFSKTLEAML